MSSLYQENSDLLIQEDKLIFSNGEVLFSEGDPSHYLYLNSAFFVPLQSGNSVLPKLGP